MLDEKQKANQTKKLGTVLQVQGSEKTLLKKLILPLATAQQLNCYNHSGLCFIAGFEQGFFSKSFTPGAAVEDRLFVSVWVRLASLLLSNADPLP